MNVDRLRSSFLDEATEAAERTVAAAEEQRRAQLDEAQRRAAALVAAARAGEADARVEVARTIAAARRRARTVTLAARLELYEELRRHALAAATQLRDRPSYIELLRRLERAARADLGADAVVELDAGGVVARAGSRIVDYSLPALVDRCVATLGERVEELWR